MRQDQDDEGKIKQAGSKPREQMTISTWTDLSRNETGGFELAAALAVTMAGIDQQTAERVVQRARAICLYSNAIRSNVDVAIPVSVR